MTNIYQKITSYEAKSPFDKVLLLYSGGLDTSVMIKWIQDKYKCDVYTLTVDIGQTDCDFQEIKKKALKLGVKKTFLVDAKKEFAENVLSKAIKANASYQGSYHLFCPLGRVMISKKAVEFAQKEGIFVIAHGCTGKGNDQVRFDSYITILDPKMKILAPVRESSLTRKEQMKYVKKYNIPLNAHFKSYSYDQNLWGSSAEGGEIEDCAKIPDLSKILIVNESIEKALPEPSTVTIEFLKGVPVKLNGKAYELAYIIETLKYLGSKHGIGTKIFIEDRIVGLKVRNVYEQAAAEILVSAHKELEKLVTTYEENEFKFMVDNKWAELCYRAQWFDPLMKDLNAFIDQMNLKVSGIVTCVLFKGNVQIVAMESPYSLSNSKMASFDSHEFNQQASAGFIEHYSFQQKIAYKK